MTFNLAGQSQPVIAKNVAEEPLDAWDKNAMQYHKNFANASSLWELPLLLRHQRYELLRKFLLRVWRRLHVASVLCQCELESVWERRMGVLSERRLFLGFSLSMGLDTLPLRQLGFLPGIGWGWQPGGAWMGLGKQFVCLLSRSRWAARSPTRPRPPSHPPTAAESTLVPVNLKAIPASSLGAHDTFVFRNDSAGLGVPRGSLGKLNSFSSQAVQHGAASTNVYYGAAPSGERLRSMRRSPEPHSGPARCLSGPSSTSSYSSGMQSASGVGGSHASAPAGGGGGRH